MRSLICVSLVSSLFLVSEAVVSTCLSEGQIAISFDGGPSPTTPFLLEELKKNNVSALFNIDSEKLTLGGTAAMMNGIYKDGHVLGLMLSQSLDLNSMSNDGLRATVQRRAGEFFNAFGKWPLFLRVPADLSSEKQQYLESGGYLITNPGLDLSKVWSGNCEVRFNASVGKSLTSASSSLILSMADTETGCAVSEDLKMIQTARFYGFTPVRMDKCINLESPYRRNPSEVSDVHFSFFDPAPAPTNVSSVVTDDANIGKAAINSNSSKSRSYPSLTLLGSFLILTLCILVSNL
ncbi:Carbohydrate esterase family 4 protein [Paramicrosporidium saccamoebae]|uniref:Carbohydrate esterase family 4 protein n=1 Tax=Paramicrosporidium saccamoebae TaxID=1246581 RepID=A0A2H9TFE2_9FUNG|nr:Carbohydrate esterase family 4 protein [Paramicrosporidium saccamoebae]